MALDYSKITKLITKNQHKIALQEMEFFATQHAPEYNIEISTHQTKLDRLESDNRIGLISRDEYSRNMTKLTMAMLRLLDELKSVNTKLDKVKEKPAPKENSGININKIEVTGGTVQIADIINNNN